MIWNGVEPIRITPAGSAVGGQWSTCRSYLGHCGSGRIASSAWSCTRENPEKTTDVTGSTGSGSGSHLPDGALLFQVEIRGCEAFDDGDPARLQHFGVAFLCVDWTQGVGWSMVMQSEFIHYLSVITVGCEPHQFPRRIWQKRTTFREMIWQHFGVDLAPLHLNVVEIIRTYIGLTFPRYYKVSKLPSIYFSIWLFSYYT